MKKRIELLLCCLLVITLTACSGPSKEKVEEVQEVYAQLVNRHNEVVEAYADVTDDSLVKELDAMAEKINSIGQQETKNMTDEELDAVIEELHDNIAIYDELLSSVEELKGKEKEVYALPVTLKNNTGVELFQLYLYRASDTDKGANLVEEIGSLGGKDVWNINSLYMTEEERLWHLEAIDEEGNVIEDVEIDLTGYGEDGAVICMEYSFDKMEGWIEME